jgi:nitrilase
MTIKAAVIQIGSVPFDTEATIRKIEIHVKKAAENKAQLAVLPEALISGYPKGVDFGARVGGRSPEGRDEFARYYESAIEVPSAHTDWLSEICAEHQIFMVVGVIERDGGTLYCTSLTFSPEDGLLGKHRKLMPTAMERLIWGFGDGSTLPVFDTEIGKIGSVICWENYMPMLRMAMYQKGIQLYCAPTADDSDDWVASMRHIAREGRCYVLSSCQYMTRGDFPDDHHPIQGEAPDTIIMRGGSMIVNPLGEIIAGPIYDGEDIVYADLDLREIIRGKYDFDVVGHYARPDVFLLKVDEGKKQPVS